MSPVRSVTYVSDRSVRHLGSTPTTGAFPRTQLITNIGGNGVPLLEAVDEFQRGIFFQIGGEPQLLLRAQVMAVTAHQRQQPAVLAGERIDLAPAVQEV